MVVLGAFILVCIAVPVIIPGEGGFKRFVIPGEGDLKRDLLGTWSGT